MGTGSAACLACMAGMHGCWYGMGASNGQVMHISCLSLWLALVEGGEGLRRGTAWHGFIYVWCLR